MVMVDNARGPRPIAAWHAGVWGDRYALRPLPTEVKPPPEREMLGLIKMVRQEIPRDVMTRVELGTLYVNLSAAYVQAERYQEALDAVVQADEQFTTYSAIFPGVSFYFWDRHSAAFYNAAVAYWYCGMTDAVLDMLATAKELIDRVDHDHVRTVSYVIVADAIDRLRERPDWAVPAAKDGDGRTGNLEYDAMRDELDNAVPTLTRAADRGNVEAAVALAVQAKVRGNLAEAISWYAMAANLGDPDAATQAEVLMNQWQQLRATRA